MREARSGFTGRPSTLVEQTVAASVGRTGRHKGSAWLIFLSSVGDGYVYPAFQIGANGLLPGVREVLAAFRISDPWMRVNFMLTGDRRLDDRRPIDLLRGGAIADVMRAAVVYGEQGSA